MEIQAAVCMKMGSFDAIGRAESPRLQNLEIKRLRRRATYRLTSPDVPTMTADSQGRSALSVRLDAHAEVRVHPGERH